MNKRNKIIYLTSSITLILVLFFWMRKGETEKISDTPIEVGLSAAMLVSQFKENEELANSMYTEQLIEIKGRVKEVTFLNHRNTIVLYGNNNASYVLCDMQTSQKEKVKNLKQDQNVLIKGVCKGFLKDVIVLNCILINKEINE